MTLSWPTLTLWIGEVEHTLVPGPVWRIGVGRDCDIELPERRPVGVWLTIRHAGIWSARPAADGATRMWVDGDLAPVDRGTRLGEGEAQDVRLRRRDVEVTFRVAKGAGWVPPPPVTPAPLRRTWSELSPVVATSLEAGEPAQPVIPTVSSVENPSVIQPPSLPRVAEGSGLAAAERPRGAADEPFRAVPSAFDVVPAPAPIAPEPAPSTFDPPRLPSRFDPAPRVHGLDEFVAVMREKRWPGQVPVRRTAGGRLFDRAVDRVVVVRRALRVGDRTVDVSPGPDGFPTGPKADLSVFDLLKDESGTFPRGAVWDDGLAVSRHGGLVAWHVRRSFTPDFVNHPLTRLSEVRIGPETDPPGGDDPRQLPQQELVQILNEAVRRLVG